MNRSLCWVDQERWQHLVERCGLTPPAGQGWIPATRLAPLAAAAGTQRRTPPAGARAPVPAAGAEPPAPDFEGPIDQRLDQLLEWIGRSVAADSIFVADESGLPMASVGESSDLVTTGVLLSAAYAQLWPPAAERQPLSTCLLFPDDRVLTVTESKTDLGCFALGYLCDGFTAPWLLARIRRELQRAFEEKGDSDG